jgi:hypothetical protein
VDSFSEDTVKALVKAVAAGDYARFLRLGAVAATDIFAGGIAAAAVDGLLDRVWTDSAAEKDKAEAARADRAEQDRRIEAALRRAFAAESRALAEKLETLRQAQQADGAVLRRMDGAMTDVRSDIASILERIDAFTQPATGEPGRGPAGALVHMIAHSYRVPFFARSAEVVFTVHNFTPARTKLAELTLDLKAREEIPDATLARAGEVKWNHPLSIDVAGHDRGRFNLLEGQAAQFLLAPEEAEGFSLELGCDDGYRHAFELSATLVELQAPARHVSPAVAFELVAPITRPETLRRRRAAGRTA